MMPVSACGGSEVSWHSLAACGGSRPCCVALVRWFFARGSTRNWLSREFSAINAIGFST